MYATGILPLILKLKEECRLTKQVWFADDASAAATCCHLRHWWDRLSQEGPKYGYYPNAAKTYLIVKEEYLSSAEQAFADTDIKITTSGKRHLEAALGSIFCQHPGFLVIALLILSIVIAIPVQLITIPVQLITIPLQLITIPVQLIAIPLQLITIPVQLIAIPLQL